jgi:hypothetical protein
MIENGMFGCAFTKLNLSYSFRVMRLTMCSAQLLLKGMFMEQSQVHRTCQRKTILPSLISEFIGFLFFLILKCFQLFRLPISDCYRTCTLKLVNSRGSLFSIKHQRIGYAQACTHTHSQE